MLALFKEEPVAAPPPALELWRKSLDQGKLPEVAALGPSEREWGLQLRDFPWLGPLLEDPTVREIFAHGPSLVEAVGEKRASVRFPLGAHDWGLWVETLAVRLGTEHSFSRPCVSVHWEHAGSSWRVTLLHASLSPEKMPKVFFRRLSTVARPWESYGLVDRDVTFLMELVRGKANVLVAGPTGSGKTSLLGTMLAEADPQEHLLALEDTRELHLPHPRQTRLLSSPQPGRSLTELLAHALRLSPDRLVLGEMRSHEVVPFLLAMNTGHRGLMATLHASSAMDALHRVAQLFVLAAGQKEISYQEVLRLVCRNVGYVVYVEERRVKEVIRVFGCDGGHPLYELCCASTSAAEMEAR